MLPKRIHYVWVGPNPLPPLAQRCLASWKRHLPDYEFRFWNEANSPMQHPYVARMYGAKKWAFVADYIRFWALEQEGGIYLDTDTEVLKSFDPLLEHAAFFGQTKDGVTAAGVIGAVPHHPAIAAILQVYDDLDVAADKTSPIIVTETLATGAFTDATIYDYRYFNPCDDGERCTEEKLALAYTNNHWAESWVPYRRIRKLLRRIGIIKMYKRIFK